MTRSTRLAATFLALAATSLANDGDSSTRYLWTDWDGDGLNDVFALAPDASLRLHRAVAADTFEDATRAAGLEKVGRVRAVEAHDLDGDGRIDLALVSTAGELTLRRGLEDGTFADVTRTSLGAAVTDARDVRVADFDEDGRPDLVVVTVERDRLFRQTSDGAFSELEIELRATGATLPPVEPAETPGEDPDETSAATPRSGEDPDAGGTRRAATAKAPPTGAGGGGGADFAAVCAFFMRDVATSACSIQASTIPVIGMLHPLTPDFNLDTSGRVGVGTTTPGQKLDVVGNVRASGRLMSRTTTLPPLSVLSQQTVPNLSADLLDGFDASAFSRLGSSIEGSEITNGTITGSDLQLPALWKHTTSNAALLNLENDGTNGVGVRAIKPTGTGFGSALEGFLDNTSGFGVFGWARTATGPNYGVFGRNDSDAGRGVHAEAPSPTGLTFGTSGIVLSPSGYGAFGENQATSGVAVGVHGTSSANHGDGVFGLVTAPAGTAYGVRGLSYSMDGAGVFGGALAATGQNKGVYGLTDSPLGTGVRGEARSTGGNAGVGVHGIGDGEQSIGVLGESMATTLYGAGVRGTTTSTSGDGVKGEALATSGPAWGVNGVTSSPAGYGVFSVGDMGATGVKSFVNPHPTDASKEIRFVCLEGNESGTYFRGSGQLVNGQFVIEVPEEFRLVSEMESLTVQVTGMGPSRLWVSSKSLEEIVVRGAPDVAFDYFVNGVRRGFADMQLVRENYSLRPSVRGEPFARGLPQAVRDLMVANGTLNSDYTPNESTAAALGWNLADPDTSSRFGVQRLEPETGGQSVIPAEKIQR